jgi:hypothetical protein
MSWKAYLGSKDGRKPCKTAFFATKIRRKVKRSEKMPKVSMTNMTIESKSLICDLKKTSRWPATKAEGKMKIGDGFGAF